MVNGAKDAGVAELTETLNALSIGVRDAASGPGVQDSELVEVLANLDIAPGAPAHPTAIKAVEAWAGLEEQPEFAEPLSEDEKEIFMEKVNTTFKEDDDISDDDDELDSAKDSESAGGGGKKAPPSFAESCGIGDAGHFLNKAKMAFLAATFARPDGSWTFRVFADS